MSPLSDTEHAHIQEQLVPYQPHLGLTELVIASSRTLGYPVMAHLAEPGCAHYLKAL